MVETSRSCLILMELCMISVALGMKILIYTENCEKFLQQYSAVKFVRAMYAHCGVNIDISAQITAVSNYSSPLFLLLAMFYLF